MLSNRIDRVARPRTLPLVGEWRIASIGGDFELGWVMI